MVFSLQGNDDDDDDAPAATRESLEWFRRSRERWQQRPRHRILSLTPSPHQEDKPDDDENQSCSATNPVQSFTKGNDKTATATATTVFAPLSFTTVPPPPAQRLEIAPATAAATALTRSSRNQEQQQPSTNSVIVDESPAALLSSETNNDLLAAKAARIFDAVDLEQHGLVSEGLLEDLLDGTVVAASLGGEGTDECYYEQLVLLDPDDTGTITRQAFVEWYVNFVGPGDDDEDYDDEDYDEADSGDDEDFDDKENNYYDDREEFEEESDSDSASSSSSSSSDVDDAREIEATPQHQGWGTDFLSQSAAGWKCDTCLAQNDDSNAACAACETPRYQVANNNSGAAPAAAAAANASVGSGGFSFGSASTTPSLNSATGTGFSFGIAPSNTGNSVFGLGGAANTGTTGFSFGGVANTVTAISGDVAAPAASSTPNLFGRAATAATSSFASTITTNTFAFGKPAPATNEAKDEENSDAAVEGAIQNLLGQPTPDGSKSTSSFPPMPSKAPTPFGAASSASFGSFTGATGSHFGNASVGAASATSAFSGSSFGFGKTGSSPVLTFGSLNEAAKDTASKAPTTFGFSSTFSTSSSPSPFGAPASTDASTPFGLGSEIGSKKNNDAGKSHRDRLVAFYTKYNPDKLSSVDATLKKYEGRETELFAQLQAKYVYPAPEGTGPITFLEFQLSASEKHIVKIQLFADKTPFAAENFRCLCTGEKGTTENGGLLCYRGNEIHRIVPNMCVQGGDITVGDGTGGVSIYNPSTTNPKTDMWGNFEDEHFLSHTEEGVLSMANDGKNRNNSQFFITLKNVTHLNGKHVVFGKVIDGMDIVRKIGGLETDAKQRPLRTVKISDCGEIKMQDGNEILIRSSDEAASKKPGSLSNSSVCTTPTAFSSSNAPSQHFGSSATGGTPKLSFGFAPPSESSNLMPFGTSGFSSCRSVPSKSTAPATFGTSANGFSFGALAPSKGTSAEAESRSPEFSFRSSNADEDSQSSKDGSSADEPEEDCEEETEENGAEYIRSGKGEEDADDEDFIAEEAVGSIPQWGEAFKVEDPQLGSLLDQAAPHPRTLPEESSEEEEEDLETKTNEELDETKAAAVEEKHKSTISSTPVPTSSILDRKGPGTKNKTTDIDQNLPTSFCKPVSGWTLPALSKKTSETIEEKMPHVAPFVEADETSAPSPQESIDAVTARESPRSLAHSEDSSTNATGPVHTKADASLAHSSDSSSNSTGPIVHIVNGAISNSFGVASPLEPIFPSFQASTVRETSLLDRSSDSSSNATGPVLRVANESQTNTPAVLSSNLHDGPGIPSGPAQASPGSSAPSSDSSTNATGPVIHTSMSETPSPLRIPSPLESTGPKLQADTSFNSPSRRVTGWCTTIASMRALEPGKNANMDGTPDEPSQPPSIRSVVAKSRAVSESPFVGISPVETGNNSPASSGNDEHNEALKASPVEFVSINKSSEIACEEAATGNGFDEMQAETPPRSKSTSDKNRSPVTPRVNDEGSVKTTESSVAERIEVLHRDIEESNGQLEITKQKVEKQQALLESRQLSVQTKTPMSYSKTLGGSEDPNPPSTPSPLRYGSLRQAESTSIAEAQKATRSALHRMNHPDASEYSQRRPSESNETQEKEDKSQTSSYTYDSSIYDSVIAARMRTSPNRANRKKPAKN